MGKTKIEWATDVWNPMSGCTKVSAGCAHCYGERMADRFGRSGVPVSACSHAVLESMCRGGKTYDFGNVLTHPDRLNQPFHWRKPRRVFVCSMGDLFHEDVPTAFIASVWRVMAECPQHTFIVLTKRAKRMELITSDPSWPVLPNVIGMVTAENQEMADERIPHLLRSRFAVRGVSVEPMLGTVDLHGFLKCHGCAKYPCSGGCDVPGLDWVICGGESGPGARPMHPDRARSLRDQCVAAGVPFLFKQHGEFRLASEAAHTSSQWQRWECGNFVRIGKKSAGRLLDGREWSEYPEARERQP